jgi:S1-C subfamily serine protease
VVQELLERGRVTRAYLGVGVQPVTVSQGRGQILLAVEDGSAAERGGLLVGDVILAANGTPLSDPDALQGLIDSLLPGGELALRIVRGGENIERAVTLGERGAS